MAANTGNNNNNKSKIFEGIKDLAGNSKAFTSTMSGQKFALSCIVLGLKRSTFPTATGGSVTRCEFDCIVTNCGSFSDEFLASICAFRAPDNREVIYFPLHVETKESILTRSGTVPRKFHALDDAEHSKFTPVYTGMTIRISIMNAAVDQFSDVEGNLILATFNNMRFMYSPAGEGKPDSQGVRRPYPAGCKAECFSVCKQRTLPGALVRELLLSLTPEVRIIARDRSLRALSPIVPEGMVADADKFEERITSLHDNPVLLTVPLDPISEDGSGNPIVYVQQLSAGVTHESLRCAASFIEVLLAKGETEPSKRIITSTLYQRQLARFVGCGVSECASLIYTYLNEIMQHVAFLGRPIKKTFAGNALHSEDGEGHMGNEGEDDGVLSVEEHSDIVTGMYFNTYFDRASFVRKVGYPVTADFVAQVLFDPKTQKVISCAFNHSDPKLERVPAKNEQVQNLRDIGVEGKGSISDSELWVIPHSRIEMHDPAEQKAFLAITKDATLMSDFLLGKKVTVEIKDDAGNTVKQEIKGSPFEKAKLSFYKAPALADKAKKEIDAANKSTLAEFRVVMQKIYSTLHSFPGNTPGNPPTIGPEFFIEAPRAVVEEQCKARRAGITLRDSGKKMLTDGSGQSAPPPPSGATAPPSGATAPDAGTNENGKRPADREDEPPGKKSAVDQGEDGEEEEEEEEEQDID